MLFLIRHGERADKRPDLKIKYDLGFDPPLTPDGHRMAFETGMYLANYLSGTKANIQIISSPFMRCMETSMGICKALNINNITVDYRLSEYMIRKFFPRGDPSPFLHLSE